jgi:hypothetical protein
MFIGILSDSFNEVRMDAVKQSNEYEIVEFMVNRLSALVGNVTGVPIKPDYILPKTSLEQQVETIDEKTDVIMDYMRNLCDEDMRTANWLESDKSTNKKNKIISFALKTKQLDLENDLFDSIPVLIRMLDKINDKDLVELMKLKESQQDFSSITSTRKQSAVDPDPFSDDDDASIVDNDNDSVSEDAKSVSEVHLMEMDELSQDENNEVLEGGLF